MKVFVLVCAVGACAGDALPPQARNVALVASDRTGNGVFLGGGLFLTNWHVCLRYQQDETLGPDDYVLAYNDAGDGSDPYDEGASIDGAYCLVEGHYVYAAEAPVGGACAPISNLSRQQLRFDDVELDDLGGSAIVFAQKGLDLCIVALSPAFASALAASRPELRVETSPVHLGQEVVVAGHAGGEPELSAETCAVIAETAVVADPDRINPSDLAVPSFRIDCTSVAPGSSGSPVFDPATGALLGLVWTGTTDETAMVYTSGYVTAASAWLAAQAGRPAGQYSRLAGMMEEFRD